MGLALHYRQAPVPSAARTAILDAIASSAAAQRFEVREGILVAELYPRINVNKGTALRRVVERFALDGLIFFGDDLTDVDAMHAAALVRAGGAGQTITVAVRHPEASPIVAQAADFLVEGVAGVERALAWLAATTGGSATQAQAQTPGGAADG